MDTKTATIENKFTRYQVLVIVLIALTQFTVVLDFMVMSPLGDMKCVVPSIPYIRFSKKTLFTNYFV